VETALWTALDSVATQIYPAWEVCAAVDGTTESVWSSILDDLLGIVTCPQDAIRKSRGAPDRNGNFGISTSTKNLANTPAKQLVLCFEVLIHQPSEARYRALIEFLASHAEQTLLVSGYETDPDQRRLNPMLFFYAPLEESLRRIGKFVSIDRIGTHSDVGVYRCNV
jgi:hypothetical protein